MTNTPKNLKTYSPRFRFSETGNPQANKGFTLLEVLLSVAIIAVLAGMSIPIYQSFQNKNDLDIATTAAVQSLRRAQILSQAVEGDTSWGARLQSGSVVLFKGTSYAGRDSIFDEVFEISSSLTLSGLSEVVFGKFSGAPQATGNITLTSANNDARTITINSKGNINY